MLTPKPKYCILWTVLPRYLIGRGMQQVSSAVEKHNGTSSHFVHCEEETKSLLGQLYITDASYLPFLCFHFLVIYLRKTHDRDMQLRDGPTFSLVTSFGRLLHWSDPSSRLL